MEKNKSSEFYKLILYSVPFTLITIGNATLWLIAKLWRAFCFIKSKALVQINRFADRIKQYQTTGIRLVVKVINIAAKANVWFLLKIIYVLRKPIFIPKVSVLKILKLPKITISQRWTWFIIGALSTFFFFFLPYQAYEFINSLPNPKLLTNRPIPVTTKIYDRNGTILFELYADQNRTPIALSKIPRYVKQATIAIEDREFYNHLGFSPRGIVRALRETIIHQQLQGGSTITQQLIKNALLTPEPTISRKVKEIILAFWAERLYTKNQILEMYFNQVPYGGTYWGIETAAHGYFNKSVSDLSLAEAAFLAGLPAAPTFYSPFNGELPRAKLRQANVLNRMVEEGFISQKEASEAEREKLVFAPQILPIKAPHFVMYIKDILNQRYGLHLVEQGGLRITTTLDLPLQEMAEDVVSQELEKIAPLHVGNGGVLITNPRTGEILAMVGSKNYFDTAEQGNVNVTRALRQPGSSIKVVTYAAALQKGFTAASIIDDSPVSYAISGQAPYQPVNYDNRFHGKVPLRYALGNSYNIPAVKVLSKIGIDAMISQGRKMGIKSWQDTSRFGLSLTLGAGEVTMIDMATVYGTLANKGHRIDTTPILEVTNYKGQILEELKTRPGLQAVPKEVSYILSNILSDNQARTWAFGPKSTLVIPGKTVAVKTGTSNEKRDNWTIGYTPSYVVTVWVGNNDNSPMNQTLTSGVTGAAPIWHTIMENLLKDKADEPFIKPDRVVTLPCFFGRTEYFIKGTEPPGGCPALQPSKPAETIPPQVTHIP